MEDFDICKMASLFTRVGLRYFPNFSDLSNTITILGREDAICLTPPLLFFFKWTPFCFKLKYLL